MCPDKSLLSAFFDREIDEPFNTELETHIAECDSCRRILDDFKTLRDNLCQETLPEALESKQETWQLLRTRFSRLYPIPVWRRRFQIPAPLFAALAFLIILLGAGLVFSMYAPRRSSAFDTVTGTQFKAGEYATFEAIIKYLDARGDGQTFVFTLPQDTKVQYWSEPKLIKAADYKRGVD